jgi:hypothetical protein
MADVFDPTTTPARRRAEEKFNKAQKLDDDVRLYQRQRADAETAKIARLRALRLARDAEAKEDARAAPPSKRAKGGARRRAAPPSDGWRKIENAPEDLIGKIQEEFASVFESAGSPAGAALFCDHVIGAAPTLYFTPEAAAIAQALLAAHDGVPCKTPERGIFLTGSESAKDMLKVPDLMAAPKT